MAASTDEALKTEIAPGVWINAAAIPTQPNPESKKSLKRKQKQAEREEQKKAWKKQRKEADRKRKLEAPATTSTAIINNHTTSPPNATEDERKNKPTRFTSKVEKREEMVAKARGNCQILIDCDWDGVMHEKEVKSLCSQLMFSFSELKKAAQPSNILLSKCDGRIKDVLAKINGSENWVCFERYEDCLLKKNFGGTVCAASSSAGPTLKTEVAGAGPALSAGDTSCTTKSPAIDDMKPNDDDGISISCAAAAPAPRAAAAPAPTAAAATTPRRDHEVDLPFLSREKTIYLTADTDNVLTTLDPEATYIIGGVVDRNRLKQATKQRADHYGIKTARLPIAEYAESNLGSFSKVLTVNHVVMILLEYQACGDWTAALEKVLPKRRKECGDREVVGGRRGLVALKRAAAAAAEASAGDAGRVAGEGELAVDGAEDVIQIDEDVAMRSSDGSGADEKVVTAHIKGETAAAPVDTAATSTEKKI